VELDLIISKTGTEPFEFGASEELGAGSTLDLPSLEVAISSSAPSSLGGNAGTVAGYSIEDEGKNEHSIGLGVREDDVEEVTLSSRPWFAAILKLFSKRRIRRYGNKKNRF
jgi:hypothetical protein